jgi:transcriptional regulator with XRE-family HTH domain
MIIDVEKDADIKVRIAAVIKGSGKNKSQFARDMGVTPNYLATVLTNSSKGLSGTMLKALANMGINVNWVITGKGDELIENGESWKIKAEKAEAEVNALKLDMDRANHLVKNLFEQIKKG